MKNITLFELESLKNGKISILCSSDGQKIYEYENGVLYDTDANFKRTTSHRMSAINLTIKPFSGILKP